MQSGAKHIIWHNLIWQTISLFNSLHAHALKKIILQFDNDNKQFKIWHNIWHQSGNTMCKLMAINFIIKIVYYL